MRKRQTQRMLRERLKVGKVWEIVLNVPIS